MSFFIEELMCFFVYAPNSKITIQYAAESIRLLEEGKSEVIADMLVSNDSDTVITELNVIYPNQFFKINESSPNGRLNFLAIGEYEDHTESILERESPYNWQYKDPYNLISLRLLSTTYKEQEEQAEMLKSLELLQPHPLDPVEQLSYTGLIGGKIEITPIKELTDIQWLMLQLINYTVFTATFLPPIQPHSNRWVRWRFKGRSAVVNYKRKREWLLKYTNQLHYDYQIQGMYDVKNRFMELLYVLKSKIKKEVANIELFKDIEELIDIFEKSGLRYPKKEEKYLKISNVVIPDWRLHITPGTLSRLTDIVMRGNVEVIGGLPNFVGTADKVFPVYEWKAGPNVTVATQPDREYSFSIFFQGKEFSWLGTSVFWGCISICFIVLIFVFNGFLNR